MGITDIICLCVIVVMLSIVTAIKIRDTFEIRCEKLEKLQSWLEKHAIIF